MRKTMKKLLPLFILIFAVTGSGQITIVSKSETTPTAKDQAEIFTAFKQMELEEICGNLTEKSYDKVSGETTTYGRKIIITKDKRSGFVINTTRHAQGWIALNFDVVGAGSCIDDDAVMEFLFRDGTRLRHASQNKFNCDGKAAIYFNELFGNKELLETLKTKQIETLRIYTYKSALQQDFTKSQSIELMNQLKCLSNL